MWRRILARGFGLALASTSLWAQTLSIPPSLVTRGSPGSLLLTLQSPPEKAAAALQWEFTFPPNVAVELADITVGSAAASAEKSITCRARGNAKDAGQGSVYACILAGGLKPIPNGPIALVRYRVPMEIKQIAEKVQAGKAVGATVDLKSIEFAPAQGTIVVK